MHSATTVDLKNNREGGGQYRRRGNIRDTPCGYRGYY
nr:MAG TPA: hypothetical protein [Caudoviricetes sp.]